MIAQLRGKLVQKDLTELVIDVNGIGFGVSVPLSTSSNLPGEGSEVTLLTKLTVREDDLHLYGFATSAERKLFCLLTDAVSGIGPKLALNILSTLSVEAFSAAVTNSDLKMLSKISGIGKRTAERIIVELRDKVAAIAAPGSSVLPQPPVSENASPEASDAVLALEALGFKHDQADKAVAKVLAATTGSASTEQLLRKALALLNS